MLLAGLVVISADELRTLIADAARDAIHAREAGDDLLGLAAASELTGTGLQYWFTCKNLGAPFDGRTATLDAVEEAGIDLKAL